MIDAEHVVKMLESDEIEWALHVTQLGIHVIPSMLMSLNRKSRIIIDQETVELVLAEYGDRVTQVGTLAGTYNTFWAVKHISSGKRSAA